MLIKNILSLLAISILFLTTPSPSHAVVQSINGQTGQNQTFSNDSNIIISSLNNVHALQWAGLLPVSRGGTGTSSFTDGSIPFIWNGIFSESSSLKWDDINQILIVDNHANLEFRNTDPPQNQKISFSNDTFQVSYEPESSNSAFVQTGNGDGISIGIDDGKIFLGDSQVAANYPKLGTVQIQDQTDAFDHNTTLYIGGADSDLSPGSKLTGCLVMGDSDGDGVTYITANDGVLTASATKPTICQ